MQDYMEMSMNDPRHIAPTIASTNPLPTSELVARRRSQFLLRQNENDFPQTRDFIQYRSEISEPSNALATR